MRSALYRRIYLRVSLACVLFSIASGQSRTQECFGEGSIEGYKTIEDINLDMEDILMDGSVPGPYEFRLCPITTFSVTEPLRPLLSDCNFVCGAGGEEEGCIIDGGDEQVVLEGNLFNITFQGIGFQSFQNTSVAARASGNSTVLFDQCDWTVSSNGSFALIKMSLY